MKGSVRAAWAEMWAKREMWDGVGLVVPVIFGGSAGAVDDVGGNASVDGRGVGVARVWLWGVGL